ncbi:hypothetical protein ABTZ03_33130 [Kitasatospora sp. NPDC096077]|uniref:hypothetical protein n=1 Tax=Kitasatospora sp. NPDC096077 TaxID=3155544 RepID=UPI0033227DE6
MTDGEWWRKSGPWSERAGAPEPAVPSAPAAPPAAPSVPPAPAVEDSVYGPSAGSAAPSGPSTGGIPNVSLDLPGVAGPGEGSEVIPSPMVQSSSPWTMTMLDFSDTPQAAPKVIPEQRAAEEEAAQRPPVDQAAAQRPPVDQAAVGSKRRQRKAKAAPAGGAGANKGAGKGAGGAGKGARRPSPLILLSCGLLVGGAISGFFPAMLAGWGLGYLSRQLSDLTRKFVILGIPLITMSVTALLAMQHAKEAGAAGGGGAGVHGGSPLGQFSWSMAPGVLRTAAVLTAVVLLLLSMRRRPPQQG